MPITRPGIPNVTTGCNRAPRSSTKDLLKVPNPGIYLKSFEVIDVLSKDIKTIKRAKMDIFDHWLTSEKKTDDLEICWIQLIWIGVSQFFWGAYQSLSIDFLLEI